VRIFERLAFVTDMTTTFACSPDRSAQDKPGCPHFRLSERIPWEASAFSTNEEKKQLSAISSGSARS